MQITEQPLIIEVRCNENRMRTTNPHLPYTPEEIAREARLSWEAGAAVFHWHVRDPGSGEPVHDVDAYVEVARLIRNETDLILQPTLGYTAATDPEDRVAHLRLAMKQGTPFELIPVDFGSVEVDAWNETERRFEPGDAVYVNNRDTIGRVLGAVRDVGGRTTAACWTLGQIRTAQRFQEMGLLEQNPHWELVFTGDELPGGAAPTLHALQARVTAMPPDQIWTVLCFGGDVMPLAALAITLGGNVAAGTGDFDYLRLGAPNNAQLVDHVRAIATAVGRPVATPSQARKLLSLT